MRRPVIVAIVVGLVAAVAGLGVRPDVPRLTDQVTGDRALATAVRGVIDDPQGLRGLAVALVDGDGVRIAGLGDRNAAGDPVTAETPFEIGSIQKTLTGMLLAHRAEQGAVDPDGPIRTALPELTGPVGEVTYTELASHRSGLPRLAGTGVGQFLRTWWTGLTAGNPYAGQDVDWLLDAAAQEQPDDTRGQVHYSNLGMSLLGHALAAEAGTTYPALLERELLQPLGMTDTALVTEVDAPPAGHAAGTKAGGRSPELWRGAGYAPAGIGAWSTADDLAALVKAMLAGTAPGGAAATARFDDGDDSRIGYAWFTTRHGDRDIVWHNGATGGFSSYVGFDRVTGRGVVVLGNTDRGVEAIGRRLLGVPAQHAGDTGPGLEGWIGAGVAIVFAFFPAVAVLSTTRRAADRLTLVPAVAWAVLYLGLAHRLGDWSVVAGWLWSLGAGLTTAAAVHAAYTSRALPVIAANPRRRAVSVVASTIVAAVATIVIVP
ncbi:serine hydrolase domain-containing protein [Micromonospora coxensis]|uniref:CubicO group peptidase, beta-lactamase class C family n=1 Tax=Micromonospora coxensis TaxID=356852 RepID=A0A1C5K0F0_9ACTN|nr:serine hydrolase domain-containing protein [Micromonospora coxensis]SCG75999.1 CubicO group peptidase, beta-lactamase class C family [Micromonospora coxensis]